MLGKFGHSYEFKNVAVFPAHCTCAYRWNCKHAAACLFALRDRSHAHSVSSESRKLDRKIDTWLTNLRAQEEKITKPEEPTHHLLYCCIFVSG